MTVQTPTLAPVLTRREYLVDRRVSHEDYYAQFVTAQTLNFVGGAFDAERLSRALDEDRHLNSIQLERWTSLTTRPVGRDGFASRLPFNRALVAAAGESITRATLVCIAKRAARMLVEQHRARPSVLAA